MNKRILIAATTTLLTASVVALNSANKPHNATTGSIATSDQQTSRAADNNKTITGIPDNAPNTTVNVPSATTPASTVVPGITTPASDAAGAPDQVSTPVTQPKPKQLVEKHIEYRDYPVDPSREDGFCVSSYDDGSTSEAWVGRRPKENSQRYQLQCP